MWQTANDLPWATIFRRFSAEPSSDGIDQVGRQVREVAERLMLDLSTISIGTPEQVGLVDLVLVPSCCGGYVY